MTDSVRTSACLKACEGVSTYWLESNADGQLLSILRRAGVYVSCFASEEELREWERGEMERLRARLISA